MIVSEFNDLSDVFQFGQYSGMALSDVIDWDYHYIYWCMGSITSVRFLIYDSAIEELKQVYPRFNISDDFESQRKKRLAEVDNYDEYLEGDDGSCYDDDFENSHYEKYTGSYAQDEMGYSDGDVDTIFDGEPDAYWNID